MAVDFEHEERVRAINSLPNLTGRKISIKKHNYELQGLFDNGIHIKNHDELTGSWYVFMLTGILPSFRRWKHHKVFYAMPTQKTIKGHNVFIVPLFKKLFWGRNRIEDGVDCNVINYDTDKNSFMFRKIRDQIKFIPELGIFIGKFNHATGEYYRDFGPEVLKFDGYFTLAPTFMFKKGSKLADLCKLYSSC